MGGPPSNPISLWLHTVAAPALFTLVFMAAGLSKSLPKATAVRTANEVHLTALLS